jgi:hypothetical protein
MKVAQQPVPSPVSQGFEPLSRADDMDDCGIIPKIGGRAILLEEVFVSLVRE